MRVLVWGLLALLVSWAIMWSSAFGASYNIIQGWGPTGLFGAPLSPCSPSNPLAWGPEGAYGAMSSPLYMTPPSPFAPAVGGPFWAVPNPVPAPVLPPMPPTTIGPLFEWRW